MGTQADWQRDVGSDAFPEAPQQLARRAATRCFLARSEMPARAYAQGGTEVPPLRTTKHEYAIFALLIPHPDDGIVVVDGRQSHE